jgi:hypothetical protein
MINTILVKWNIHLFQDFEILPDGLFECSKTRDRVDMLHPIHTVFETGIDDRRFRDRMLICMNRVNYYAELIP